MITLAFQVRVAAAAGIGHFTPRKRSRLAIDRHGIYFFGSVLLAWSSNIPLS